MQRRYLLIAALSLGLASTWVNAARIVIGTDTKIFETPIAKDEYAAVNDNDEPVLLKQGMAFTVQEEKAGWYIIEYSPGLRGMVMTNVVADPKTLIAPVAGAYNVVNNPAEKVNITREGIIYTLTSGDKSYQGKLEDNVIIFTNADGIETYSITVRNGKPQVFNYANSITKFF